MRASFVVGKRTGGVIGNAQTANGLMYLPAVESDKLHEPRATCGFFSSHFVPTLYQILKPIPTFALLEA